MNVSVNSIDMYTNSYRLRVYSNDVMNYSDVRCDIFVADPWKLCTDSSYTVVKHITHILQASFCDEEMVAKNMQRYDIIW